MKLREKELVETILSPSEIGRKLHQLEVITSGFCLAI